MAKIVDVNKATLKLYDIKNKKKLISNLHKSFSSLFFAELLQKLFYLWLKGEAFTVSTSLKTLKDNEKFVNITYNLLPSIKGKSFQFVISLEDITEKKKVEKAFIRNQKLNTLGEIASSVAHDFNNSLQAILGNLELVMFDKSLKNETLRYLDVMKTLVVDASNRVSVLQRFGGKKEVIIYKYINIKKLITDVVDQFAPVWKVNSEKLGIRIDIDINCNNNLIVLGNKGELHSVIHNLLKNSIEAMPKGGKIYFDVEEKEKNIEIFIKDTGIGMDKDTQSKIFQAFYTTKGFELGRGLGMSGVYRIIKDHKGDISILKSSPKKGTTFKIVLPACNEEINEEVTTTFEEKKESKLLKENLEILWVDDEKIIRTVMNQYLGLLGYKCDIAESGMQALELMKNKKYNLIITDIGMPNMNGWQLIDEIRNKYSRDIKIVVVTGWILEITKEEQKKYNIYDILEKPIQFKDLEKIFSSLGNN